MKTVLFLQTTLGLGGAETVWYELIQGLNRRRFRPVVCCLYEPGVLGERLKESGVPVFSHRARNRWDLRVLPRLVKLLKEEQVDILYFIHQPLVLFWGVMAARLAGVKVLICSDHFSRVKPSPWISRFLLRQMDTVVAPSRSHKKNLMEQEKIEAEKIEVVFNGVDPLRFSKPVNKNEIRERLKLTGSGPLIGIVAKLRPEKCHDTFLQAALRVLKKTPDAVFLIVGDGPERQRLEGLSQVWGISPQVRFLGNRSEVPEILSLLNIAVLCSRTEVLPIAVLEYMMASKPVVVTAVGSLPEIIENGRDGFLVPPGDFELLADRILALIAYPEKARQMGEAAREKALKRFGLDPMIRGTEQVFERWCEKKNVAGAFGQGVGAWQR